MFRIVSALAVFSFASHCVCAEIDFNRDIRPILSNACFQCHGPDAEHREADLRLDQKDGGAFDVRDGQRVIKPKDVQSSTLVSRITSKDESLVMPPPDSGKELTPEQIDLLKRWIAEGAKWSQHWAYVSPRSHQSPAVRRADWPRNWIDNFVLARLEREKLSASPDADRATLIRRLSFDLIGLPPTRDDVAAFVNDKQDDAYERLVDRLLESEHFGERMAIGWLDVVRYADTVGYHGDQDHSSSPYRDYVIDAFNDNIPFDQFTREQLAGDLVPNSGTDQKIASAYNRLLQTSHEGGVQAKEYLAMYAADRIRNVSGVWLGATMGCCQCHDHKYDPYTMKDFYSLAAFFADIDEADHLSRGTNGLPTIRRPEIVVHTKRERARLIELDNELANLKSKIEAADSPNQKKALQERLKTAQQSRDSLQKSGRTVMISKAIKPREIRLLPRGNWLDDSGSVMQPEVPEFLPRLEVDGRRANRLDLANWLTSVEDGVGGLTARVFVNRLWDHFFAVGLAKVLDDFGGQGEPPVHPELLDQLAVEFLKNQWNVKHMVKLIVMSRTYQQASVASDELRQRDPENRLYARQSSFRLPAELVRDNALAISGLLVRDIGGPSVKPYQPAGYYRHLNFPRRKYSHHNDARQWRRGLYVHWQRQFLHPMMRAFDAPRREECTAKRSRSNTPNAALTMLNDPTFVEAARHFAARIVSSQAENDAARINLAMQSAVARPADLEELGILNEFLIANREYYKANVDKARELLSVGNSAPHSDVDASERAAWTAVARAILNMSETITRN